MAKRNKKTQFEPRPEPGYDHLLICQTPSGKSLHEGGTADGADAGKRQTLSAESPFALIIGQL
jgi:hypothetical protein